MNEHYSSLKPLFALDPLLLPNVIYCCPFEEYSSLFEKIDPSIALSRITYYLTTSAYSTGDEVGQLVC